MNSDDVQVNLHGRMLCVCETAGMIQLHAQRKGIPLHLSAQNFRTAVSYESAIAGLQGHIAAAAAAGPHIPCHGNFLRWDLRILQY